MTSTDKPTSSSSSPELSVTATSSNRKPPCATPSSSYKPCLTKTRFLLKQTSTQSWLADHDRISDTTQLFTNDPQEAMRFVSVEVATQRARLLLHLYPDLCVDVLRLPLYT
jgi:hypothetical protein